MSRVWIERPIESVEDAEALPEGTVVLTRDLSRPYAWTKDDLGDFRDHYCSVMWPQDIAGDDVIALVPVEAEEQWGARDKAGSVTRPSAGTPDPHAALEDYIRVRTATGQHDSLVRRLVTPWEAAD